MYATERQQQIENRLADDGRVTVVDLAREFDVSNETVRRDLDQLELRGVLRRVHGGAVSAARISRTEESIAQRSDRNAAAKERIALAALALIPSTFSGAIAIDSGTTTGMLAQGLSRWQPDTPDRSLTVITHSIAIASAVSDNPHIEVQIIGGRLRGITSAAVGPTTLAQLSRLRPDIAFVGANGLHSDFGFSTPDPDEAAVKTALTRGARRAIALVDASKLGVETLVSFATLADIDTLVTDKQPDIDLSHPLRDADVEVVLA
ncbi:DeoR/GlpR family DNA-binding transcription regulator [Salinibacterium hongtaonis]|uniref:Lactose phosphotransferase system repressor n=1 Tax=Homoserinimonas hongtaonis TaxID=2079791 RepID=A0A2U1T0H7_9MICO|nr:DeoR/GlpR family DNA-binding transcription regulator [Salinibacterium hongtaonis]PWB97283.1 D-beta-D-heptose 1-phosphate adenosyltransferase [Salinibacterium hongtaonis]